MDQNGNGSNAGAADAGNSGAADLGNQGATPGSSSTPDNQGGTAPDSWEQEKQQMSEQIKALNKAVVDARRQSRNAGNQNPNGDQGTGFDTPEGQYAASIQIATSQLRNGLEGRLSLYPEITPEDAQRIRMNPWAFANQDLFFKGDWESALDEIEQHIADRVDALAANNGTPQPGTPATPASVNGNPADAAGAATPETSKEDLWSMPMDQLEKEANKQKAKLSQGKT